MPQEVKKLIEILSKYATCDMSDALVKYKHKYGGSLPNLHRYSSNQTRRTMVGKAYTVLFAPKDDPREAIGGGYIDNLPEDSVLVIATTLNLQKKDAPYTKMTNALYGGLMSTRATYLKSRGTVVFGRVRDIDEHLELNRDVFSYDLGSAAHGPVVKMVGINVPVEILIDGYPEPYIETINPGDIIMGDDNGVVKVPNDEELSAILDYIPKRVEADTLVKEDILAGEPCTPAQKKRRAGL
jgi:regulator of RNase E activity RraA